MDTSSPPPRKRLKFSNELRSTVRSHTKKDELVSRIVMKKSVRICDYLDVTELLQYENIPDLNFLKDQERNVIWDFIQQNRPSRTIAMRLLECLRRRNGPEGEEDFQKFLACISMASEHRGHKELEKIFRRKVGEEKWLLIQRLIDESDSPDPSPYSTPSNSPAPSQRIKVFSPERPMTLITLQGKLVEKEFVEIEMKLWLSFSKGQFEDLEHLLHDIRSDQDFEFDSDCQVVALWFQSLVMMHRHVKYSDAIQLLDRALDLTDSCVNKTILAGRILQRKAQIYLMMNQKVNGARTFEEAKEYLQFVGRGYDKTNMFCREAKMLSATAPHKRDDIEKVYQDALSTLEKDDPYFLASYPSVTLSKAAFHLHFAFGSKPAEKEVLPTVPALDVKKAKETLKGFDKDEHILISMRQLEYDVVQAELCRLEGREDEAQSRFEELIGDGEKKKTGNISSIAQHRLKWMSHC